MIQYKRQKFQGHFSKACRQIYKIKSITAISLAIEDAHQDKNGMLLVPLG